MNLYESRPAFELIQPKLEIKEEEFKYDPGTSNSSWNDVARCGKPEVFEARKVKMDEEFYWLDHDHHIWNKKFSGHNEHVPKKSKAFPRILRKEESRKRVRVLQKDTEFVADDMPILEAEGEVNWRNEKRKRLSTIPPVVKTTTVNVHPNNNFNPFISTCFSDNKHPSVQLMVDLSEICRMPFRQVFEQFENLRNVSSTFCPMNDTCSRIRIRFDNDSMEAPPSNSNSRVRLDCSATFEKLNYRNPIEEKDIHLILESQPQFWHLPPSTVRTEWALYQKRINDIFIKSKHKFPSDQLLFARNRHPSIQEMQILSQQTQIPYETIYQRFEELRFATQATCDKFDTCQLIRVRSVPGLPRSKLTREMKVILDEEFEKVWTNEKKPVKNLPLDIKHLLMEQLKMAAAEVQKFFWQWSKMRLKRRATVDPERWTEYRYTETERH